jgi:hypothetical protein
MGVLDWIVFGGALLLTLGAAAVAAVVWKVVGWDAVLNEAVPGAVAGLAVLLGVAGVGRRAR